MTSFQTDGAAMRFLIAKGWTIQKYNFIPPSTSEPADLEAVRYLQDEWDFGDVLRADSEPAVSPSDIDWPTIPDAVIVAINDELRRYPGELVYRLRLIEKIREAVGDFQADWLKFPYLYIAAGWNVEFLNSLDAWRFQPR